MSILVMPCLLLTSSIAWVNQSALRLIKYNKLTAFESSFLDVSSLTTMILDPSAVWTSGIDDGVRQAAIMV